MDNGVDGFKIGPARTIDEHPNFKYYNGHTDKEMHNLNQILLPKQMYKMMREHTGLRSWHHYTAGWSGTQHWSASTSGDNGGGRTALFDQLNLGMSGFLNTSCDVMNVNKDEELQSLHFGLFLPWVQINSWYSLHQPFYFPEKEKKMYRDYVKLRYALMPYIYSAALEGAQTGMPVVRSMPLMFPDDRKTDDMVYQYMFGQVFWSVSSVIRSTCRKGTGLTFGQVKNWLAVGKSSMQYLITVQGCCSYVKGRSYRSKKICNSLGRNRWIL